MGGSDVQGEMCVFLLFSLNKWKHDRMSSVAYFVKKLNLKDNRSSMHKQVMKALNVDRDCIID